MSPTVWTNSLGRSLPGRRSFRCLDAPSKPESLDLDWNTLENLIDDHDRKLKRQATMDTTPGTAVLSDLESLSYTVFAGVVFSCDVS